MITTQHIADILEGELHGDGSLSITGLAKIEEAKSGSLSFIANPKYEKFLESTAASCVLVGRSIDLSKFSTLPGAVIVLDDPYASFVIAIEQFNPKKQDIPVGIHPTAVIHPDARVGEGCAIGPYVVIGDRSVIGNNCILHPHVVIGRDVQIGDGCQFYSHVSIREECRIGHRVIIQPGAVIGGDGFGFAPTKNGSYRKIPQLGIVVIEDDVEIQANTCVDRATLGDTRIKKGTKLDNLVQIAHNVVIGEHTVIAGLSGVAGSTKVGDQNMVGGGVCITGHVATAKGVKVEGASVITKTITQEDQILAGYPAKDAMKWRRIEGALRNLPDLAYLVSQLESRIRTLEEELKKPKQ